MLHSLIISSLIVFTFVCLLWIFSGPEDLYPDLD